MMQPDEAKRHIKALMKAGWYQGYIFALEIKRVSADEQKKIAIRAAYLAMTGEEVEGDPGTISGGVKLLIATFYQCPLCKTISDSQGFCPDDNCENRRPDNYPRFTEGLERLVGVSVAVKESEDEQ